MQCTSDRDRQKPNHHNRTEHCRDFGRATTLRGEERHQNNDGEWHNKFTERRTCELKSFDRGENRNRWSNHRVTEKHRCADYANDENECGAPAEGSCCQRGKRQRPALPVVIGTQQDENVFERYRYDECPDDERKHAEHDVTRNNVIVTCSDCSLTKRVKRARPDIAVDDANATERQARKVLGARPDQCARRQFSFAPSLIKLTLVRRWPRRRALYHRVNQRIPNFFPAHEPDKSTHAGF